MSTNQNESSLTAPEDRDLTNKWKPNQFADPLTPEQMKFAMEELNKTAFIEKFPKLDRT